MRYAIRWFKCKLQPPKNPGILGEILMELRTYYQTTGTDISDQNILNPQEDLSMTNQNIPTPAVTNMTNQNLS